MYSIIKLSNGLKVVLEEINYVNSVSVGVWVENGSRNENIHNNGISHFIEHMLFKGTNRRSAKDIVKEIEEVGGQINAFTGKEATCFFIKVLDTHFELTLDVLSDMLFNSKFTDSDMEKEKAVVLEEINMNEDNPEDLLSDLQCRASWGKDPISMPILGTLTTVNSITREHIKNYVNQYYIPENSVISICGNVKASEVEKLVEKYFGNWHSENKKITKYSSPEIQVGAECRVKNIEQLHINLGLKGIALGNDEVYSLQLLNNILGGGASSILFQKIREDKGLCYSIYSYLSSYNNTGLVNIYVALSPAYALEALKLIKSEINDFTLLEVSEDKLSIFKEQMKGNYILALESTSSRMFSNGKSLLFHNKINTPQDIIAKIDKIDLQSLKIVMDKTFRLGILNCAFVGSKADLPELKELVLQSTTAYKPINLKTI